MDVTVRVRIPEGGNATGAMTYLSSPDVRRSMANEWAPKNAPGCGIAQHGGIRPWFEVEDDRTSPLIGYQCDFRFTPSI
jgi:hypothetical protein